jgi:lipoate---protein ligase
VRSLGVDARVNERNDICVGANKISLFFKRFSFPWRLSFTWPFLARTYFAPSQHVSGSAYKITNKRAYHHGTMLISTRLDHLGTVLRPETVPIAFPTSLTAFLWCYLLD